MIYMWTIVTESASPGDVRVLHVTKEETIKSKLSYCGRMATDKKALFTDYPACHKCSFTNSLSFNPQSYPVS